MAIAQPAVLIEPQRGWLRLGLGDLWHYRELLYFLVWRDVKVRYKQTLIGAAWAVIQPLLTVAVFTLVFSVFANIRTDGVPYPLFAFAALLPWTCFAQAISRSGMSLVGDARLISKVYFPRVLVPTSAALGPLVDFAIAAVFLLGLMAWYGVRPTASVAAVPLFLLLAVLTALAAGLWLSALNVRYRDVGHAIPFLVQIWMYLSPVAYPVSVVPERWLALYSLNPMVGVIEGFRWALLGTSRVNTGVIATSTVMVLVLLVTGLVFFKRMERSFADVI